MDKVDEITMRVDEEGFIAKRQLKDGRWLCVVSLTFGRARIGITNKYTYESFDDAW